MIDNCRTNSWHSSLRFSVLQYHGSTHNRLSTITVLGLYPVLRDNDHRVERDAKRISCILPPSARHRRRLLAILLRVSSP